MHIATVYCQIFIFQCTFTFPEIYTLCCDYLRYDIFSNKCFLLCQLLLVALNMFYGLLCFNADHNLYIGVQYSAILVLIQEIVCILSHTKT